MTEGKSKLSILLPTTLFREVQEVVGQYRLKNTLVVKLLSHFISATKTLEPRQQRLFLFKLIEEAESIKDYSSILREVKNQ